MVVAGLGRHAGGELSRAWVSEFKLQRSNRAVHGVFVLPFEWESQRRHRALAQAALFAAQLDSVVSIDNHAMAADEKESWSKFAARIDALVMTKIWWAATTS